MHRVDRYVQRWINRKERQSGRERGREEKGGSEREREIWRRVVVQSKKRGGRQI